MSRESAKIARGVMIGLLSSTCAARNEIKMAERRNGG